MLLEAFHQMAWPPAFGFWQSPTPVVCGPGIGCHRPASHPQNHAILKLWGLIFPQHRIVTISVNLMTTSNQSNDNERDDALALINATLQAIQAEIRGINERLDRQDERFDKQDERFNKQDERFARQDERFAEFDKRAEKSDERWEKTIERGDRLAERLQGIAIAVVLAAAAAVIFRPLVEYLVQANLA